MKRTLSSLALIGPLAAGSCLTLDPFFFTPETVEEYLWDDDDPCDPQLIGEIARAENERLGGPTPTCHPSLVPPENRVEGFVEADGEDIHYVYAHRDDAVATIFYSHGRAKHLGNYWDRVELMWEWGFNVLIYDYPGYGRSTGEPDEAGIYASAQAALELLPTLPDVDPDRVFFMGYSLGGAPTFEMALRATRGETPIEPRGVLTESIFCSTEALIQDGSFTNLSVDFLSDNPFDNCAKMPEVAENYPVRIIHGERDDFIVPRHAKMLLDASDGEAERFIADDAKHSDIPVMVPDEYEMWLTEFFSQ